MHASVAVVSLEPDVYLKPNNKLHHLVSHILIKARWIHGSKDKTYWKIPGATLFEPMTCLKIEKKKENKFRNCAKYSAF